MSENVDVSGNVGLIGNVDVIDTRTVAALGHGNDTLNVFETVDAPQRADGIGRQLEQRSAFRESLAATWPS